jgi:hypothetical protein
LVSMQILGWKVFTGLCILVSMASKR